jgi:GntR family transcriptional regulator
MKKRLNTNKEAAPLYIQVKQDLKNKIEEGYWKPGDKITSELELCDYYDVSRITIREAINELVWEDYLVRKRAKGTFVLDYKTKLSDRDYYTYVKSFTYEMNELGQKAQTFRATIEKIQANQFLAKELDIPEKTEVIKLERLRGSENKHPALFITYFKYSPSFSSDANDYYGSFYEMLKGKGITLEKVREYLEAIRPDEIIQKQLDINEDMPVLKRARNAKNSKGDFVEYTECYYVGENYRYYIDLTLS